MVIETANQAFARGIRPDVPLTVSEWADAHRVLAKVSAGEPGPWRTSRTPYLAEVMDCLSPSSPTENVVLMKGAQLGGSEAALNFLGYIMAHCPAPTLLVLPSTEAAQRYSKQRLSSMIEHTPVLRDRVADERAAGRPSGSGAASTVLVKQFAGGMLIVTGANSSVGLRSMPAKYLVLDEVDAFPPSVGAGVAGGENLEGDPVSLAIARTATFPGRKILMLSTPTTKGLSRIEAAFLASDQRFYFVPCPECGEFQRLVWSRVIWPEGRPGEAAYQCVGCEAVISHIRKTEMLAHGAWQATAPGDGKTAGFHLSGLYSPWQSWAEIATKFLQAKRLPETFRPWVNNSLGESWEDAAAVKTDPQALLIRCEPYAAQCPAGVALLTAGADVQADRIVVEIVGWGRDEESWSIGYHVILGDPARPEVWTALDDILTRPYTLECGLPLHVGAVCIDSGHRAVDVYNFTRPRFARHVYAVKGALAGAIWPRKPSTGMDKSPLFMVGTDAAKTAIYAYLRIDTPGPGFCHFPRRLEYGLEFFAELTAERAATKYTKGFAHREWRKEPGARNEALDCRVYALAALHSWYMSGLELSRYCDRVEAEIARAVAAGPKPRQDVDPSLQATPRPQSTDRFFRDERRERRNFIDPDGKTKDWFRRR